VFPSVGGDFLGFRLVGELGRGAFGRVYLAHQGDLADRPVALKVSTEIWAESQLLARLQHTHIVPVYSLHRSGRLQAVCMPYYGSTTLADILDHLAEGAKLPRSGKGLVTTLRDRQNKTRHDTNRPVKPPPSPDKTPRPAEETVPPDVAATKATLQMLEGLSYVDAILWVVARLAEGLAHAHERGVLHRDLKPANVLLTDEGQPMLLDFNLSADTRKSGAGAAGAIGGTLPYMAPEHLAAYLGDAKMAGLQDGSLRPVDARSDIFSLGVILFELLTGKHPYTHLHGLAESVVPLLIRERVKPPPSVRALNPEVSRAVESIVHRCIHPEPARRYQSATELQEDLDRQRKYLPLKFASEPSLGERFTKWRRRHPALTSTATVVVAALVLILALSAGAGTLVLSLQKDRDRHAAVENVHVFHGEWKETLGLLTAAPEGGPEYLAARNRALQLLDRYAVLTDPNWQDRPAVQQLSAEDQRQLRTQVGQLLVFLAEPTAFPGESKEAAVKPQQAEHWTHLAEACFDDGKVPQALWRQRAKLSQLLARPDEVNRFQQQAQQSSDQASWDLYLQGREARLGGDLLKARKSLEAAIGASPSDYASWQLLADFYRDDAQRPQDAIAHYNVCIALLPEFHGGYLNRGRALMRQNKFREADADFCQALKLHPGDLETLIFRGQARQAMQRYGEAEADLTEALKLPGAPTHVYFLRSRVRLYLGDKQGAKEDLDEGMLRNPTDEYSYIARGAARVDTDPQAALADFEKAVALNPRSFAGLQDQAHVLSERLGKNAEAVSKLDQLLKHYPDFVPALAGRAVLHARLGQREAALQDVKETLLRDQGPATLYQLAGVYALSARDHPEDRKEAYRLLFEAVQQGYGLNLLAEDPDLTPLRNDQEFHNLADYVRRLLRLQAEVPSRP
jgi:serine/threonine protein kinase/tetratricopeptide (TPR) repeat protein